MIKYFCGNKNEMKSIFWDPDFIYELIFLSFTWKLVHKLDEMSFPYLIKIVSSRKNWSIRYHFGKNASNTPQVHGLGIALN